jgi:hypothetical protein
LAKTLLRSAGVRSSIRLAIVFIKHGTLFSSQACTIDLSL